MAVAALPVPDMSEELVDGRRRLDVDEAAWLALLNDFDRSELWSTEGYLSAAEWVGDRCRMGRSTAYEKLRIAAELRRRPVIAAAFADGHLSYSHVRLLTRIVDPDRGVDEALVNLARHGSVRDLERALRHYDLLHQQERGPARDRYAERGLHNLHIGPGMGQVRATLPDAELAEFSKLMAPFLDRSKEGDHEVISWDERRADALMEMARAAVTAAPQRAAGVDRYMTHVIIDIETLMSNDAGVARLLDGTPIDADTVRAMACDSGIVAQFVRNGYEPLDVGRRVQSFTVSQRRVIMARDEGTCRWPGCERTIVDCHHLEWFSKGGKTAVDNGICLCSRHHQRIHKTGFRVEGDADGTLTFYTPDGQFIGFSAPPSALPLAA